MRPSEPLAEARVRDHPSYGGEGIRAATGTMEYSLRREHAPGFSKADGIEEGRPAATRELPVTTFGPAPPRTILTRAAASERPEGPPFARTLDLSPSTR